MELYRLNEIERQMAEDLEWGETAREVQQHAGRFVVVHQKRVVAVGSDRATLVEEAAQKEHCPKDDLVVLCVPGSGLREISH